MNDAAARYREAVDAFARGDAAGALAGARALLQALPDNAATHALAGAAAMRLGQAREASAHLRRAEALEPARPDHPAQLAQALAQAGHSREALAAAQRAVALAPGDAGLRFLQATLLTFNGALDAAAGAYEACIGLQPTRWRAHLALAQAKRWTGTDNHIERLRGLLARHGGDTEAKLYLELALAKELEDLGDHPAAFAHLSAGKAAHRARRPYDFARDRAMFDALREVRQGPGDTPGDGATDPILVVGMPRTGTTLVDRILSSHPQVRSAGERFDFARLLKQASGSRTSLPLDTETIAAARSLDWARVGAAYLRGPRSVVAGAPRFVDKLPHNFLYLGFIARALPNARIVCLRRERLDTCVANFRQLLATDSPFFDYSFDLLDTGRYVLEFERLMAHWHAVLPGRVLDVRYEDLVDDQAGQTRLLLMHCGLPWDDACLAFERNPEAVATASAVQVREPLNRDSVGRWKRYEPELAGLRALLGEGTA